MHQQAAQATWNPERDLWETDAMDLFSGHSDAYSETFPISGMTRNGQLFLRPQSEPHTGEIEYSSWRGLLPTPRVSDHTGAGEHGQGGLDLRTAVKLLPTPTSERPDSRKSPGFAEGRANFFDIISNQKFGHYAPAIKRWEAAMGRTAPEPTGIGPNGKANLSARFVEWMMGQSDGWVTDEELGLSRVQQLRALGNGVVTQQAVFAINWLLERAQDQRRKAA